MDLDLTDRQAIVTGGGRGIGETIAIQFARAGADVVVASRTKSELDATVDRIEEHGSRGHAVRVDLRSEAEIDNLMAEADAAFGPPDILVNNAGVNIASPPLEHTTEEIDTMLDVNLRGMFLLSQRFARRFKESSMDRGRIINISSIGAHVGVPKTTLYGGTKAGVCGITRALAGDVAKDGITVNSVSPGLTRTERIETLIESDDWDQGVETIPVGRLGEPDEVANACLYLASDLADYVTGEDILVDGGVTFTAALYSRFYE